MSRPLLTDLEKLSPAVISEFRRSGKSMAIPEFLQVYIVHLDKISELYNHERNINRLAHKFLDEFPDVTINTAKSRIYDAINYFHLNSEIREEAWCNYYADYFEDLAKLARNAEPPNLTESRRCVEKAAEYRIKASTQSLNPDEFHPVPIFINPDISPERLGISEKNLKKMWINTDEFIDELPIDNNNKSRVKKEAALNLGFDIEDSDYEEVKE